MLPAIPPALLAERGAATLAPRLQSLVGVPYVDDGVLDEKGRWTRFGQPDRELPAPGLNCSGFLVAACRGLLGFAGSPAQAGRDRLGDSGPASPRGRDWDYGWDLLLNLSEGLGRRWILPAGPHPVVDGEAARIQGCSIHDLQGWEGLRLRLRMGKVYLATFYRVQPGGGRSYHHVGLVLPDGGRLWFYQTLPRGHVHRLDLAAEAGLARFREMFGPGERWLLLEVDPA